MVSGSAVVTWSTTGARVSALTPMSPRIRSPTKSKYRTGNGSSSPFRSLKSCSCCSVGFAPWKYADAGSLSENRITTNTNRMIPSINGTSSTIRRPRILTIATTDSSLLAVSD